MVSTVPEQLGFCLDKELAKPALSLRQGSEVTLKGETLTESAMPTKIPFQEQGDRMVNAAMQKAGFWSSLLVVIMREWARGVQTK